MCFRSELIQFYLYSAFHKDASHSKQEKWQISALSPQIAYEVNTSPVGQKPTTSGKKKLLDGKKSGEEPGYRGEEPGYRGEEPAIGERNRL